MRHSTAVLALEHQLLQLPLPELLERVLLQAQRRPPPPEHAPPDASSAPPSSTPGWCPCASWRTRPPPRPPRLQRRLPRRPAPHPAHLPQAGQRLAPPEPPSLQLWRQRQLRRLGVLPELPGTPRRCHLQMHAARRAEAVRRQMQQQAEHVQLLDLQPGKRCLLRAAEPPVAVPLLAGTARTDRTERMPVPAMHRAARPLQRTGLHE